MSLRYERFREFYWQATGDRPWLERAACHDLDHRIFYPERGESLKLALRICHNCPVESECLEYAVTNNEKVGIWGGTSERTRRTIRRTRKAA